MWYGCGYRVGDSGCDMVAVVGLVMVVVTWLSPLLPLFLRMARARACTIAAAASAHVLRSHECVRVRLRLPPGLWCRRLLVVHVASVFPCVSSAHVTLWCSMLSVAAHVSVIVSFESVLVEPALLLLLRRPRCFPRVASVSTRCRGWGWCRGAGGCVLACVSVVLL